MILLPLLLPCPHPHSPAVQCDGLHDERVAGAMRTITACVVNKQTAGVRSIGWQKCKNVGAGCTPPHARAQRSTAEAPGGASAEQRC